MTNHANASIDTFIDVATTLLTSRQIASKLDRTPDQVRYVLGRFSVEPVAVAGHVHLFAPTVVPLVREQLEVMDKRLHSRGARQLPVPAA